MSKRSTKKRKIELCGAVRVPKTFFLMLHEEVTNKVLLVHQDKLPNDFGKNDEHRIITAVDISGLSVYFGFLGEADRVSAYTELINLIAQTTRLSLAPNETTFLPPSVKQVCLRAMSFYRSISGGYFVTDIFKKRLMTLVMTIWKHGRNYLGFLHNAAFQNRSVSIPLITQSVS